MDVAQKHTEVHPSSGQEMGFFHPPHANNSEKAVKASVEADSTLQ